MDNQDNQNDGDIWDTLMWVSVILVVIAVGSLIVGYFTGTV